MILPHCVTGDLRDPDFVSTLKGHDPTEIRLDATLPPSQVVIYGEFFWVGVLVFTLLLNQQSGERLLERAPRLAELN